jgi:malonyl-CoA O-methyltransferase
MDGPGHPSLIDRRAVRRGFERAAAGYDAHAVVATRVEDELLGRLGLLGFEPATVLDLGCGTGRATRALRDRYREARVIGVDLAAAMLALAGRRQGWFRRFDRVRADATRLPFADATADLAFASLVLPFVDPPDALFAEVRRVLAPRGYFTFATFGPGTLVELRAAWAAVDGAAHVHPFPEMHELGDALVRAGFADPVLDLDRLTVTYADVGALLADLRGSGARNAARDRPRGLGGRDRRRRLDAAYETFRQQGRLPASVEVVYGQAWCPGTAPPVRGRRGEATVPLASIGRRTR